MRRRVLPLDAGTQGSTKATVSTATTASGRHSSVEAAARAPSSAMKGARRAARGIDGSTKPVESNGKKRKRRSKQPKRKRRLAVVGTAAAVSALVLVLSLFVAPPFSFPWELATSTSDAVASGEMQAIGRFLGWFRASGGRADNVDITSFPGMGKGVVARSAIREDDAMLFVPKDIIICSDTIFEQPSTPADVLSKLESLREQEDELLTAFLLLEQLKGPASHWSPYLELLPQRPPSNYEDHGGRFDPDSFASPLFFANDDQVEQLQDPHMVTIARDERSSVQRAFRRFKRLFGELVASQAGGRGPAYEHYVWARFLVNSRAFSIHGRRFLVPFGDFFNGQSQQQARVHDNGRHFLKFHELQGGGMVIRADRNAPQAHQVFEDYGDNDNYIYFLYHGFLMSDNMFDCAMVQLPPVPTTLTGDEDADKTVRELKMRVLRHFGVANGVTVCVSPDGSIREAPLARFYSTLYQMRAERMKSECDRVERYARCFISKDVSEHKLGSIEDTSALELSQFIRDAVRDQLAAYPTTLEDDDHLMQEHEQQQQSIDSSRTGKTPNFHAIRFRASRKRILKAAIAALSRQIGETIGKSDDIDHMATIAGESSKPATAEAINSAEPASEVKAQVADEEESTVKAPATSPRHRDGRFERFQRWIQTLEFPINHLELRYVNDAVGYGAFATKQLDEEEVYLRVPISVVMSVRSALQSPSPWLSRVSGALGSEQSADMWLTLHLLDEKFGPRSHQSRWKPYLDMLPSVEAGRMGSPLFYPENGAEMQILARTDLFPLAENYRRRVLDMYSALTNAIDTIDGADGEQLSEWLTLDRFLWANAVLDSRSIWWGGQRHLVPLLDMVNCRELAPNKTHEVHHTEVAGDGGRFADTRASWTFAVGDEVVENYGQPNYIYLLYHGFVLEHNSHDCAHLRVDFAASFHGNKADGMGLRRRVAAQLELLGVFAWQWDVCVAIDDDDDVNRFAHMALLAVDPERAIGTKAADMSSIRQEQAAAALKLVQTRLDRLGTSVDAREAQSVGEGCVHCDVVSTYVDQHQRHFHQLRDKLNSFMSPAQ